MFESRCADHLMGINSVVEWRALNAHVGGSIPSSPANACSGGTWAGQAAAVAHPCLTACWSLDEGANALRGDLFGAVAKQDRGGLQNRYEPGQHRPAPPFSATAVEVSTSGDIQASTVRRTYKDRSCWKVKVTTEDARKVRSVAEANNQEAHMREVNKTT